MPRNIFLAYASNDRPLIEPALDHLQRRRLVSQADNVFYDFYDYAAGEDFRQATREAMEGADTVVVIWSSAAAASKWVNYELGMADALGKKVVLLVPDGDPAHVPANLSGTEVVEMPA